MSQYAHHHAKNTASIKDHISGTKPAAMMQMGNFAKSHYGLMCLCPTYTHLLGAADVRLIAATCYSTSQYIYSAYEYAMTKLQTTILQRKKKKMPYQTQRI